MEISSKFMMTLFGVFAITLSGCDSLLSWSLGSDDSSEIAFDESSSSTNTSATETLNVYTDLVNDVHDAVNALDSSVQYADYDLTNYDPSYGVVFSCYFDIYNRETLYNGTMNPVGLPEDVSNDLKTQATLVFNLVDQIDVLCRDFHKYVTAQEYKTDLEKGNNFVESLYSAMDNYYTTHNALVDKLDGLYDIYSPWEVDPNDPISVTIDNMSKDMDQADLILDLVEEAYVDNVFTRGAELQSLYDTLTAQVASHTGANTPVIDPVYSYNRDLFYDDMELNFLPNAQVAIRAINEQNVDDLSTAYWNLLDYYNYLVDSYNYFLDGTGY